MVIGYLMHERRWRLQEAFKWVSERRPTVKLSPGELGAHWGVCIGKRGTGKMCALISFLCFCVNACSIARYQVAPLAALPLPACLHACPPVAGSSQLQAALLLPACTLVSDPVVVGDPAVGSCERARPRQARPACLVPARWHVSRRQGDRRASQAAGFCALG